MLIFWFLLSGIVKPACQAGCSDVLVVYSGRAVPVLLSKGRGGKSSRLGKASRLGLGCNRDCLTLSPALYLDCQCGSADLAVAIPLLVPFCFCFLLSAASFKLSKGVNLIGSVLSALHF